MSLPTIFAQGAANPFVAKGAGAPQGVIASRTIAGVPGGTAVGTIIGMIRFQKDFSPTHLALFSNDLDTPAEATTFDVGYVYDDNTVFVDDDNAFFSLIDIAQDAGARVWPSNDDLGTGVSFVADGDGYIAVTIRGGSTTTFGNIFLIGQFTYDLTSFDFVPTS